MSPRACEVRHRMFCLGAICHGLNNNNHYGMLMGILTHRYLDQSKKLQKCRNDNDRLLRELKAYRKVGACAVGGSDLPYCKQTRLPALRLHASAAAASNCLSAKHARQPPACQAAWQTHLPAAAAAAWSHLPQVNFGSLAAPPSTSLRCRAAMRSKERTASASCRTCCTEPARATGWGRG